MYLKDGKVQLDATGGLPLVGVTWAPAAKGMRLCRCGLMANPFDRLSTRMDEVTAARFGRPVLIDGAEYVAAEATFPAELGALSGRGHT